MYHIICSRDDGLYLILTATGVLDADAMVMVLDVGGTASGVVWLCEV
jgi:hypothetical protein